MQHTQNYQLSRWEKDDRIMMEDFNADNEAIDAAIAAKADAEDVTALAESVNAALGSGGHNCRIAYGSYTGTGKFGSGNPNILTPGFTPVLVLIHDDNNVGIYDPAIFMRGFALGRNNLSSTVNLVWSNTSLS